MQSIETKYAGPTDTRGSRIIATTANGHHRLTVSYDDSLSSEGAHAAAALALARKLGWTGELVAGSTRTGYVFVWTAGTRYSAEPRRPHNLTPDELRRALGTD
jgi:tripartite-type tricarboxylate transporter receptor subunit TctC